MNLRRITQAGDPDFKALTALYTEAFPPEERRETAQLERMLEEEPRMHFHVVEIGGKRAGLFVYWDFGTFYYLEHLAVYAEMRNQKIGQQVLDWMREHLDGLRLLEAEPAKSPHGGYAIMNGTDTACWIRSTGNPPTDPEARDARCGSWATGRRKGWRRNWRPSGKRCTNGNKRQTT